MHFVLPSPSAQKPAAPTLISHQNVPKPLMVLSSHGGHRGFSAQPFLQSFLFFLHLFWPSALHVLNSVTQSASQSAKTTHGGGEATGGGGEGDATGTGGGEGEGDATGTGGKGEGNATVTGEGEGGAATGTGSGGLGGEGGGGEGGAGAAAARGPCEGVRGEYYILRKSTRRIFRDDLLGSKG